MPRAAPAADAKTLLKALERLGTKRYKDGLLRYGIHAPKAFGVPVGEIQKLAKRTGRSQTLAEALWKTGWYEARMLAAFVGEPERITPRQMDQWCRDFDNWAVCDTACFHLFDRSPHAFGRVHAWAGRRDEFVRRGAFALLASLALHDKRAGDAVFVRALPLIERAAPDARNFVKKAVSWALRGIGARNPELHAAALGLARRLSASAEPAVRWVGKDTLRDLSRPALIRRVASRGGRAT